MTPLTRRDVLAHQAEVHWSVLHQVEQDLLLCRSMVAIFEDPFLSGQVAMRGGTVLHKVHLAPASRYSEDIDLVAVGDRPEEHIAAALKRVLADALGKKQTSAWASLKLAVRNLARPSHILRIVYQVPSVSEPGRTLTVVIEANVSERTPFRPLQRLPFTVPFRESTLRTTIASYDIDEMLGTKMRALFQRKKGRDLFDLHRALTATNTTTVTPANVIASFQHYMGDEGTTVSRGEYLQYLDECLSDPGFCADMNALLPTGLNYDANVAGEYVRHKLFSLLSA